MPAFHLIPAEACETELRTRVHFLKKAQVPYATFKVSTVQEAVETLDRYRAMISTLQNRLAECQPQPATSSENVSASTTKADASPESSSLPMMPDFIPAGGYPTTGSPSGATRDERSSFVPPSMPTSPWTTDSAGNMRLSEEKDWPIKAQCSECHGKGLTSPYLLGHQSRWCTRCTGRGYYFLPLGD